MQPAVEADPFAYSARRTIDAPAPGDITARIIHDLQTADLVVADLTEANPNVYYELALRHSMAKPFIHLAREGTKLPFDITVMDAIFISEGKEADAQLQLQHQLSRIERGEVVFETVVSGERPRRYAKAYQWEIAYSYRLASEWLDRQDRDIQDAVREYYASPGGGGPVPRRPQA